MGAAIVKRLGVEAGIGQGDFSLELLGGYLEGIGREGVPFAEEAPEDEPGHGKRKIEIAGLEGRGGSEEKFYLLMGFGVQQFFPGRATAPRAIEMKGGGF